MRTEAHLCKYIDVTVMVAMKVQHDHPASGHMDRHGASGTHVHFMQPKEVCITKKHTGTQMDSTSGIECMCTHAYIMPHSATLYQQRGEP